MKRYRRQAADQWRRYNRTHEVSPRSWLTPWPSPWLKLRESSFELVKFESSSEWKTEASNIRTSFNILPIVQRTVGRYQRTNRPIPIIGRLSVHLYCAYSLTGHNLVSYLTPSRYVFLGHLVCLTPSSSITAQH